MKSAFTSITRRVFFPTNKSSAGSKTNSSLARTERRDSDAFYSSLAQFSSVRVNRDSAKSAPMRRIGLSDATIDAASGISQGKARPSAGSRLLIRIRSQSLLDALEPV